MGGFYPPLPIVGVFSPANTPPAMPVPHSTYRTLLFSRRPHAKYVPLKVEGIYDQHRVGGVTSPPPSSPTPPHFLKSLSIYIFKLVHVRNTRTVFSCSLHFSSDFF